MHKPARHRRLRSQGWKFVAIASLAAIAISPAGASADDNKDSPAQQGPLPTEPALRAATLLSEDTPGLDYFSPETIAALGYEPVLTPDGFAERADGNCSSPVALPASFDHACKSHDLGYDLLRAAHDDGQRIPPGLRSAIDRQLERRMHASCAGADADADLAGCHLAASAAGLAVAANTERQGAGTPIHEEIPDIVRSFTGTERGGL
ncbi:hypothetical protein [Dietzia sp.]|uniref:hypothetical protein n=1 Tax=Dietzia sp. TaxID=1871616 RepID=UPI002FDAB0AA